MSGPALPRAVSRRLPQIAGAQSKQTATRSIGYAYGVASTKAPRRLSPQKQQEQRSRAQVVEALEGWICNSLAEDFGEDFLVSIYEDGRSTGLTFQLQLKSTTDACGLVPKRARDELHYPLDVVDLLHWEDATPPVVIGIWDVVARKGYWQDVPAIISVLDKNAKHWRKKKSVTVEAAPGIGDGRHPVEAHA